MSFDWIDPRTFFLEPYKWTEPYILDGDDAHHLMRVLRLRVGDFIRLLDGEGREGTFQIASQTKREIFLTLEDERYHPRPQSGVILAAAWTKAARKTWIFEKAVEFGAVGIWFWQAERSQFPVPEQPKETWRAQMIAGAKQCRNPWLPVLRTFPNGLDDLLQTASAEGIRHRHALFETTLHPPLMLTPQLLAQSGLTLCIIGPEGGLAPTEVTTLQSADCLALSLGERVLRWETAAVLCLGLHWWGGAIHAEKK